MTIANKWIIVLLITTILGVLIMITENEKRAAREKAAAAEAAEKATAEAAEKANITLEKFAVLVEEEKKLNRKEQELIDTKDRILEDAMKENLREARICVERAFYANADGATNNEIANYVNSKRNDPGFRIWRSCIAPANKIHDDMIDLAVEPLSKLYDAEHPLTKKYLAASAALKEVSPDMHEQYIECLKTHPQQRDRNNGRSLCVARIIADLRSSIQNR